MKIYTKTGDHGKTSLFGGKKVEKDDLRIDAYGNVDELNSLLGVITAELNVILSVSPLSPRSEASEGSKKGDSSTKSQNDKHRDVTSKLTRVQSELLVLGSDLSSPLSVKVKVPRVTKSFTTRLEKEIDSWEKTLPQLKNFILPSGSVVASHTHLARSVARRSERTIAKLGKAEKVNPNALIFINRLSDWLFVLARYLNKLEKTKEVLWKGRGK